MHTEYGRNSKKKKKIKKKIKKNFLKIKPVQGTKVYKK